MTEETELEVGAFYWVIPANDPDTENEWEKHVQPARFYGRADDDGRLFWNCLNIQDPSDWPMKWIGDKIVVPS